MSMTYLKALIHQKELDIQTKKALIRQEYTQLKNTARQEMTSPHAFLFAFILGFLVTYQFTNQKFQLSQITQHLLTAKNLFSLLV